MKKKPKTQFQKSIGEHVLTEVIKLAGTYKDLQDIRMYNHGLLELNKEANDLLKQRMEQFRPTKAIITQSTEFDEPLFN